MLVLISFLFLLWTLLDTKQEALNSCSHTTTIQTKVTILLECDIASLGDWFPMFYDNVKVSSTRVKMSECHFSWAFQALDIDSTSDAVSHPRRRKTPNTLLSKPKY